MKRRERKWTKGKLLKEPQKHPILALWDRPEVLRVMDKRGEKGLHFNDLRFMLCKDFKMIKLPPKDWNAFSSQTLNAMREYNDYTILQKDLTKLCEIGFLRKESRGYYSHVERPVMRYIQDIDKAARNLIGSAKDCDIVATDSFELSDDVKIQCGEVFKKILESRAQLFSPRILDFWKEVDSSKLDIQQKILLRSDLYPFTQAEKLKKLIKKECLITTSRGREAFDIPPFKKRKPEKLRQLIELTDKYSEALGNYTVKYAIGMYSYPKIFTERYIAKKGTSFKDQLEYFQQKLQALLLDFARPCYILLAPRQ
ncbi:MAG: hypothetical protein JSV56_00520 [Methanomassiliicoccales archaeon]|nr:MAG: hypothetical protein JSV56_00520 [Methanomassiliicoccales archaeon]